MPVARAPMFEGLGEGFGVLKADCSYDDCYQMIGSREIDVGLRADACNAE